MRVNGVMGVIAVACVVAVVNAATLGPMGTLRHGTHRILAHNRRLSGMEYAERSTEAPPPPPSLDIASPRILRSGIIPFPDIVPDSPADDIEVPPDPVIPMLAAFTQPPITSPPQRETAQPPAPPPPQPSAPSFAALPAAAIPEPATWATVILGFGFVGAALRRRRLDGAGVWRAENGRKG